MNNNDSNNIPLHIHDHLNTVLTAIARENLLTIEALTDCRDPAVISALEALRRTRFFDRFLTAFVDAREKLAKLKPKHRTGGALAGRVREKLRVTQNLPGAKVVQERPDAEALDALKQKHKILALHHLVRGELGALDPAIGDASCEMRPSFLLDLYRRLQSSCYRLDLDDSTVNRAIESYRARHRPDKADDHVRRPQDIADDPSEAADMQLWRKLFGQMTLATDPVDAGSFLRLCKTYTVASSLTVDEFGLPVASRLRRRHPLTGEIHDIEALGRATRSIIVDMATQVATWKQNIRHPDAARANQVAEALRSCRAFKSVEGARLPLLPIYEALHVVLAYEAMKGRPLLFSVAHLRCDKERLRLLRTEIVAFRPGPDTGEFMTVREVPDQPVLTFRCLSVTAEDAPCPPPAAITLGEPVDRFILAYAAAHPAFAEGAVIQSPEGSQDSRDSVQASYLMEQANTVPDLRERGLTRDFLNHREVAARLGLFDFRYSERMGRDSVRRTSRSVGLVPIHIHPSTAAEERTRLAAIRESLASDELGPVFDLRKKASTCRNAGYSLA